MHIEAWYRNIFIFWLLLGLPSLLLAIGFAGGNPFDDFDFRQSSTLGIILWLICVGIMLAPVWLAPFGLKIAKPRSPHQDITD